MVVVDLESNGLLGQADKIWCAGFKDIATGEAVVLTDKDEIIKYLDTIDMIIMHNGISFDIPLLKEIYGYEFKGKMFDTLTASRVLWPDRPWGHSVDKWGKHLKMKKVENDEWEVFSPIIIERCAMDIEIQEKIYQALLRELENHVKFGEQFRYG